MKTCNIEERFWDAFFCGEYDPELYAEFFDLQDAATSKDEKPAATTKTVTRGIYNRVTTGRYVGNVEQISMVKVGEQTAVYTFEAVDDSTLSINGKHYRVEDSSEFAIKVMKTKIKAIDGANGLVKFLTRETLDNWELKIIENCKPANLN